MSICRMASRIPKITIIASATGLLPTHVTSIPALRHKSNPVSLLINPMLSFSIGFTCFRIRSGLVTRMYSSPLSVGMSVSKEKVAELKWLRPAGRRAGSVAQEKKRGPERRPRSENTSPGPINK